MRKKNYGSYERNLIADTITFCVNAVKSDKPYEAEPWIIMEEKIGYEKMKDLAASEEFSALFQQLELYCHNAQHDRDEVEGCSIDEIGENLMKISASLID